MRCRHYKSEDAATVDEIFERCYNGINRPNLRNCSGTAVIEDDGKVVAFGAIQLFPEAVMILDNEIPNKLRVKALQELIKTADVHARMKGFNDIFASGNSNEFSYILQKHFKFRPTSPYLILNLED